MFVKCMQQQQLRDAVRRIETAWKRGLTNNQDPVTLNRFPKAFAYRVGPKTVDARAAMKHILRSDVTRSQTRWPHSQTAVTNAQRAEVAERAQSVLMRHMIELMPLAEVALENSEAGRRTARVLAKLGYTPIRVSFADGDQAVFAFKQTYKMSTIRRLVGEYADMKPRLVRLMFGGKVLDEFPGDTLQKHRVPAGGTLTQTLRLAMGLSRNFTQQFPTYKLGNNLTARHREFMRQEQRFHY